MSGNGKLATLALGILEAIREPMGLDGWTIRLYHGPLKNCRACCEASPEYKEATISLDFERIKTGDDLQEVLVHEAAHCLTWPLHQMAEELADLAAGMAPQQKRRALKRKLRTELTKEAERTTTDVGQTYLRLLRRAGVL